MGRTAARPLALEQQIPHPARVPRPGGVLSIDNVLSHADEVAPFLRLLSHEPSLFSVTVAV